MFLPLISPLSTINRIICLQLMISIIGISSTLLSPFISRCIWYVYLSGHLYIIIYWYICFLSINMCINNPGRNNSWVSLQSRLCYEKSMDYQADLTLFAATAHCVLRAIREVMNLYTMKKGEFVQRGWILHRTQRRMSLTRKHQGHRHWGSRTRGSLRGSKHPTSQGWIDI